MIKSFDSGDFIDTLAGLLLAFVLGTIIGAERQYRQRSAGLRTNVLVALGACEFVDVAQNLAGNEGAVRVIAYVVSGIGFLGAGVIMKDGLKIRGLNTAATLWCSGAVGACAGGNLAAQAVTLTLCVIGANTLLLPLVTAINRRPLVAEAAEAQYEVSMRTSSGNAARARKQVTAALQAAGYPVRDVKLIDRSDGSMEVRATLVSSAIDPDELDAIVAKLDAEPETTSVAWTSRIDEQ